MVRLISYLVSSTHRQCPRVRGPPEAIHRVMRCVIAVQFYVLAEIVTPCHMQYFLQYIDINIRINQQRYQEAKHISNITT